MGDTLRDLEHETRRKMPNSDEYFQKKLSVYGVTEQIEQEEKRSMTKKQEAYGETNYLSFFVSGIPLAQGRPRFRRAGNFVQTYDPAKSKSWKESVRWQVIEGMRKEEKGMISGAIEADLAFLLPRPKSLSKKTRYHVKKPDLDNLEKSIFDALEGIAYKNDSQIYKKSTIKLYEAKVPGVSIILRGVK